MNSFARLSESEIEAASALLPGGGEEVGEFVAPVPADAPPLPLHSRYGAPSARWAYRDEAGAASFYVNRFEPVGERKQILPLTLWRDGLGQMRWRWKGVPAPRPLYNLDKLAAHPSAPVVIVEGEKSAEAATRIFQKSIATTSPAGSKAANKADWSALAGRRVLIWPDADEAGARYARDVAGMLAPLGCEVSVIDAMTLAASAPDGSKREPLDGWDAADAIGEWLDLVALRKAAVALAKPFEAAPAYSSWGAFTMSANGLTIEVERGRGDNAETVEEWICGPFEVLGATRDPNGRDWGKWLRWRDGDGRVHLRHVAEASLQGDPAALAASLVSEGLRISRAHQKALATYLCGVATRGRVTMVSRTGWHTIGGRDVFVLPGMVIGPRGSENVILESAAVGPYEARGTLKDWQEGVGALAADLALKNSSSLD